jgi:hypothetical protein
MKDPSKIRDSNKNSKTELNDRVEDSDKENERQKGKGENKSLRINVGIPVSISKKQNF